MLSSLPVISEERVMVWLLRFWRNRHRRIPRRESESTRTVPPVPSLKGVAEIKVVIFQGGQAGQNEVTDGFLHAQGNRKILEAVIRTLIQFDEFQESV